jgi:hypothetical protein
MGSNRRRADKQAGTDMIGKRHGLGFYKGAFIGCDAGHHPGWPDKDGPGAGWIFRIDLI